MSDDESAYLVTELTTDVTPPEVLKEHRCVNGEDAVAVLTRCLDRHGGLATSEMQREARDARSLVDSLPAGHHMKLCGFLLRYDVDPVPAGQLGYPTWQEMREAENNYIREQLRVQVPSLRAGNPVYVLAGAWIVAAPYRDDDPFLINPRARRLGTYWELAVELVAEGMALSAPTGTLESWMLATAQRATENGESIEEVSAQLRAEVAGKAGISWT